MSLYRQLSRALGCFSAVLVLLQLVACGPSARVVQVSVVAEPAGIHCGSGGQSISVRFDNEKPVIARVCRDDDATLPQPVVVVADTSAGLCPQGGKAVVVTTTAGQASSQFCNGSAADPVIALPVEKGARCMHGGVQLVSASGNSIVCNGPDKGVSTATSTAEEDEVSLRVITLGAGGACEQGGVRIIHEGGDSLICTGLGAELTVVPELPGDNCPQGGQKIVSTYPGQVRVRYSCTGGLDGKVRPCAATNESGGCDCPTGWGDDGLGGCRLVDRCLGLPIDCDPNAACSGDSVGYVCRCRTGYQGDGLLCEDVDECAVENGGCHEEAVCKNTPGAWECSCRSGFVGTGISCVAGTECPATLSRARSASDPLACQPFGAVREPSIAPDPPSLDCARFAPPAAHAGRVPVLLLQRVCTTDCDPAVSTLVPRAEVQRIFLMLKCAGYQTISADDYTRCMGGDCEGLPARSLFLTFDDGGASAFHETDALLAQTGLRATMFVITDRPELGDPLFTPWNQWQVALESGRWDLALKGHQGSSNINIGLDDNDRPVRGPFYTSRRYDPQQYPLGSKLEPFAEWQSRVVNDLMASKQLLMARTGGRGYPRLMAVPFGDYGQKVTNDKRIETALPEILDEHFDAWFVQPASPGFSRSLVAGRMQPRFFVSNTTTAEQVHAWLVQGDTVKP